MMRSSVTLAIIAWATVAAGMMEAAPSALAQGGACPTTGCVIPGITVPNGLTRCVEARMEVAEPKFDPRTTLCNTGPIDPATWVYGPRNDLTQEELDAPRYNPVRSRMAKGLPVIGTRWSHPSGADYCNVAKYDDERNHFTWADQFHSALDNSTLYAKWQSYCPGLDYDSTAARGAAGGWADEREAQRDTDGGAIVFIRPMASVRDAQEAIF